MMRPLLPLALLASGFCFAQQDRPEKLSIHTWVREDIFAGWMANDLDRFEKGVAKLDRELNARPDSAPAMAWRAGGELYQAVRAHEAGNAAEFQTRYAKATELFNRAYALAPKDDGVLAVTAGSHLLFADRLPAPRTADAWKVANTRFTELADSQAQMIDKLPLHMRGELLSGVAMSAQRTGDMARANTWLAKIVKDLPGTPYETRAQKWIEKPELAAKSSLACQTCHDPGRLKNRLAAAAK
ncbi:MAG: hypothetical protein JJE04_07535 [Acidobacteriia bacterium]|nr:hypothetical protein [Terriglobia bacterium]